MRTRTTTIAAALLLAALTGCSSASEPEQPAAAPSQAPAAEAPSTSAEDKAKAREAAGLPPSPEPQPRAAFLAALNALEPDLVHGKDDKAISRGLDTCSALKRHPGDRSKQIEVTAKRWTSPDHPEGRSLPTAEKVLDLSHKHLCPDF
ncbi:hypothetical protein BJP40_02595 [Streptomyces sp. CC53]|uniref:hypothetical protein n=1 Tax=Streptomyces sp. CC53 TaxID=1906740 RepID=UPI0008DD21A5|nr:hypothetical protein [Streptomyces sp. CC53]OII63787.1 hypothetical protein BJP40_02595 [Streptomyces sp. CC53]